MSFEKKLQSLRKKAGISQEELANQLGVSRQAVSKWESGTSYPEMDKLILMTRLFKCSLDDLVNDEINNVEVNNKCSKGQTYIDSLLEFITKTINMFNSMKLSSIVKCILEMILFTFTISVLLVIMYALVDSVLGSVLDYGVPFNMIYRFLTSVLFIVAFALGAVVVFQFFKVRYLDYYDKLVYRYDINETKKSVDSLNVDNKEESVKDDVISANNRKERIIIRDPHHKPLAFLSAISSLIVLFYKVVLRMITIPFIIAFVCMAIAGVMVAYLISFHTLFIWVLIATIACIILDVVFMYTLSHDLLVKKSYPIRIISIIFLISLLILGIGVGGTIISLSDIEFKEIGGLKKEEKTLLFNDKIYLNLFNGLDDDVLDFVVDNSRDDILLEFTYDDRVIDYNFDSATGNPNYYILNINYNNEYNPKEEINEFLSNLKKNVIVFREYPLYYFDVKVTASEKNIRSLVSTISEYADVNTIIETKSGYKYYHLSETRYDSGDEKVCVVDDYYRKCISVKDNTDSDYFKYEYKDNKLIYDESKFTCFISGNGYICERGKKYDYED